MGKRGRHGGTKNPPGHRAGGDRRSAKYKEEKLRKEEAEKSKGNQRIRAAFGRAQQEEPSLIEHPLSEENFKTSQKLLADVLDHPSMPKRKNVPTSGIIDVASEDGNINYDAAPSAESTDDEHYRRSLMPPAGTPLRVFLDEAKDEIRKNASWRRRKYFHRTLESPLACGLGTNPSPDKFYLPDMVRIWWPKEQFHGVEFVYKCPECRNDSVVQNAITWRPAFEQNEIRWIYCHRLECTNKNCKKGTFSSTDPSFISTLPTCIADSFEYVFPPQGPGVSRAMLRQLSLQLDNHVLFGAWAREVNDMMWESYYRKCNQYYELLNDWLEKWPSVTGYNGRPPLHTKKYDGRPMVPYSAFGEPGHHNGIMMTEALAKSLFGLVEGGKRFEYNQKSFAAWHDEGLRADDTFKICKKVFVTTSARKRVKPYSALLTLLSKQGKIVAAVWKMSMSHDTNRRILQEVKAARDHVGAPPLKLLLTDNPVGEQAPYYEVFPELHEGTVTATSLPMIEVPDDDIAFFDESTPLSDFILSFAHLIPDRDIYYGLDTEFERDGRLTVLSIAFPRTMESRLPVAIVVHLHKITRFPDGLKRLLEQPNMIPAGRQIGGDCNKLEEQYDVKINRRIELNNLCRLDRDLSSYGLKNLMEEYLECTYPMNKSAAQTASYAKSEMTGTDRQYCALDALVSLWVCHRAMSSLAKEGEAADPHPTLQVGKRCKVTHNNREIAVGTLRFVGARGEQRRWGGKTLGRSDCLVAIESLVDEDFQPRRRNPSWPDNAKTLRELHLSENETTLELAVTANQVKIIVEDSQPSGEPAMVGGAAAQLFEVDKAYLDKLLETASRLVDEDSVQNDEAQGAPPRDGTLTTESLTRSLRDLFHQFNDMPLKEDSEEFEPVLELLLVATWINDEEDYANVVEVVQNKGVLDLARHEFHNRPYWRVRIKRSTPLPKDHGNNIRIVKHYIWTTAGFEGIRTKKMEVWLEQFACKAESGMYYIPSDVKLYRIERIDSDGLNVYVTDLGTSLNEAAHQKYAGLVPSCAIGAETADVLLVLRSFRFNIAAGIKRCGEPDFHTDRHDIVDKTQHWMIHLFATFAWPTHKNLLDFNPPKTAALVGVRPLPFDENHVRFAESPDGGLSRDYAYLSRKLGVAMAPLPLSTKEEFLLYNSELRKIVVNSGKPTPNDWDQIARTFLRESNGKTVFPKTTDLLKKHYTHWKQNQAKSLFAKRIKVTSSNVYQQLRNQKAAAPQGIITNVLPSQVDGPYYSRKRPLEEKPNVVPPASAYNQNYHESLKLKVSQKEQQGKKEPITLDALKQKPSDELKSFSNRCAWYPVCHYQQWVCGGKRLATCTFINEGLEMKKTQTEINRMKQFVSEQRKLESTRERQRQRKIKRITDKANAQKAAKSETEGMGLTYELAIPIDDFLSQESIVVQSAHNAEETSAGGLIVRATALQALVTPTLMIDDDVVNA